jgi:hypothetical protein
MIKKVDKKIYFYSVEESKCNLLKILNTIDKFSGKDCYASEFIKENLFMQEAKNDHGYIKGIIRNDKNSDFPSKVRAGDKKPESLGLKQEERLAELTHFVYFEKFKIMAIEYNHTGPRASSLEQYINDVINSKLKERGVVYINPLLNKNFYETLNKIKEVKMLDMRVSNDPAFELAGLDETLMSTLRNARKIGQTRDVEIILRPKKRSGDSILLKDDSLLKSFKRLFRNQPPSQTFDKLEIQANTINNDQVEIFNFLKDKIESEIKVVKLDRSRRVDSGDIFNKIIESFNSRKNELINLLSYKQYEKAKGNL